MRLVLFLLVVCSVSVGMAAPKVAHDARGECLRAPAVRRALVTRTFEVTRDLRRVSPLRKRAFASYEPSYSRDDGSRRIGGTRDVTIVGNKLRISTYESSCHQTGMGCLPGHEWTSPGELKLEEDVGDVCITYVSQLGDGLAVGLGREMRTYELRNDGSIVAGPRVKTPILEGVEATDGAIMLQEPRGGLWVARWEKVPTVTRVDSVSERIRAMSGDASGVHYVYTDRALYALDVSTLAVRWKVDGEAWSVARQDVPVQHYVLMIERGAKSRVVLRTIDDRGRKQREILVYEGADVVEAHLERTYVPLGKHELEHLYLVRIATAP
jgi:hypothetical protein